MAGTAIVLHIPAGAAAEGPDPLAITPDRAGWSYAGLRVARLEPGESRQIRTERLELAVLPLSGGAVLECDGRKIVLRGRETVFAGISDWAYVPVGSHVRITSQSGGELALCTARATRRSKLHHVPSEEVPVELRGAGAASRQIVNFMAPDAFAGAERLMCVEVYTPDGNTSSYPPHKHDDSPECPVALEEIYYFRVAQAGLRAYSGEGFGLHRTYTDDRSLDETVEVRDGDAFLVPRGYHGPCVALPGYPLYYLNVLAGPGEVRSLAFVDDPPHGWIRAAWSEQEVDPRLPMLGAKRRPSVSG